MTIPTPYMGMEIAWLNKKRELGDSIGYTCPSRTTTWEEKLVEQVVRCIWHRQTDSMIWWPPELHNCNRKNFYSLQKSRYHVFVPEEGLRQVQS